MTPSKIANQEWAQIQQVLVTQGLPDKTIERFKRYFTRGVEVGFQGALEYAVNDALPSAICKLDEAQGVVVGEGFERCWDCKGWGVKWSLGHSADYRCPTCNGAKVIPVKGVNA